MVTICSLGRARLAPGVLGPLVAVLERTQSTFPFISSHFQKTPRHVLFGPPRSQIFSRKTAMNHNIYFQIQIYFGFRGIWVLGFFFFLLQANQQ